MNDGINFNTQGTVIENDDGTFTAVVKIGPFLSEEIAKRAGTIFYYIMKRAFTIIKSEQ